MEHEAEGHETNRGLLKGVLDEVMGSQKILQSLKTMIAADLRRPSPSSFLYEYQVEGSLPLATLWVVLRNQLPIAGRPHPNVDVGWPAAVGDGHVALEAMPSSLVGKHRSLVCIVVVSPRVGQPELDLGVGDRLALCGGQHAP